jgi:RHS repeat-associated protein
MFVASTTHRRALHARRAARQAVASGVVCAHQSSRCTLTKTNCHSKTTNRFHHRNQQYSVIALTDGSGAIAERYAYSAYGKAVFTNATGTVLADSAKDNRYTYTGREWDEDLSLYHFRARMYDAESGRFCGRDSLGYVDAENLYRGYFTIASYDPSGDDIEAWIEGCVELCDSKYYTDGGWPTFQHLDPETRRSYHSNCEAKCEEKRGEIPNLPADPLGAAEDLICITFVVFDFVTVPSGEGVAGCLATRGAFRTIRKCFKKPALPKRPPRPRNPRKPEKPRNSEATCQCLCTLSNGSTNEPIGRMARSACSAQPLFNTRYKSCRCK